MMSREEQIEEIIALRNAYNRDYRDIERIIRDTAEPTKNLLTTYYEHFFRDNKKTFNVIDYTDKIASLQQTFKRVNSLMDEKNSRYAVDAQKSDKKVYEFEFEEVERKLFFTNKCLKTLQIALKLLGKKKHRGKEFSLLKKFLSDITLNYEIMQSFYSEIQACYGEQIAEVYDELSVILLEFARVCDESSQLAEDSLQWIRTVQPYTWSDTSTAYFMSLDDKLYGIETLLLDINKEFNASLDTSFDLLQKNLGARNDFDIATIIRTDLVDAKVSRQLRKSMEEIYKLYAEIKRNVVSYKIWSIVNDFETYANSAEMFEMLTDEEVSQYYNFVSACCDALDKFPHLIELVFGGLEQIIHYVFKSSFEDEQDYRDLVPSLNKRFKQAIE